MISIHDIIAFIEYERAWQGLREPSMLARMHEAAEHARSRSGPRTSPSDSRGTEGHRGHKS